MSKAKSGILALLISIPLICFPARDLWIVLITPYPIKVNSMEEFSEFSDAYDISDIEERNIMLTTFNKEQILELECLQEKLCEIRTEQQRIDSLIQKIKRND